MRLEQLIRREHELVGPDSGMTEITLENDLAAVVDALRAADRVFIATHENPDGDAVGSLTAAAAALRSLGKQVRTYLEPESSVPHEVAFLDMEGLERTVDPDSLEGWTLLALDCGNERRLGAQYADLLSRCSPVIDVDHHHDNSRFGGVNLIDGSASSTAEILVRIFDGLGAEITPEIAESLYVGLVTDTGRFQYRTTSPAALRLGARLVESGVDVHKVFERVFESVQPGKLRLLGRVIDHAVPYCDGRLLISHVTRDDLALVEGDEATTEGLIDHLRAVEGVQVAGLIREQVPLADGSITPNRVSLRSRGLIDVSAIARLSKGGGHKQAAGFSHPGSVDDIRRFIVSEVSAQLAEPAA
jgi:phosphoesterase RecJ-like protein